MTCFDAAALSVTARECDSSPIHGCNGNLYARVLELTRSLCKVHPGDTVQIDKHMKEGTMFHKINDRDYRVVFTDLS